MVSQNKNLETEKKCKESKIKTHRSIKNLWEIKKQRWPNSNKHEPYFPNKNKERKQRREMAHCFSFAGERELLIGSERERDMNDKCDPDVNLKISLSLSLSLSQ